VGNRGRRPGARSGEQPPVRSSVKPSHAANDNLINRTLAIWKPRPGRDLNCKDGREIVENLVGYFTILAEWSRAEKLAAKNDNKAQATPESGGVGHER
jgi:hypothetical protein